MINLRSSNIKHLENVEAMEFDTSKSYLIMANPDYVPLESIKALDEFFNERGLKGIFLYSYSTELKVFEVERGEE